MEHFKNNRTDRIDQQTSCLQPSTRNKYEFENWICPPPPPPPRFIYSGSFSRPFNREQCPFSAADANARFLRRLFTARSIQSRILSGESRCNASPASRCEMWNWIAFESSKKNPLVLDSGRSFDSVRLGWSTRWCCWREKGEGYLF